MVHLKTSEIDRARLVRGWTWNELARRCPLSPRTRTKVKNGGGLSLRVARRVCRVLKLRFAEMLAAEPSRKAETLGVFLGEEYGPDAR
jgi:transcriptional regulator with XRE-family HTH domain